MKEIHWYPVVPPPKGPVMRGFGVFFAVNLNKSQLYQLQGMETGHTFSKQDQLYPWIRISWNSPSILQFVPTVTLIVPCGRVCLIIRERFLAGELFLLTLDAWINWVMNSRIIDEYVYVCPDPTGIFLSHWGRDTMANIFQTTFWNTFSGMKTYEVRLTFHWILFLRVHLAIFHHCFR